MVKVGDKFLGFNFKDDDTDGAERVGYSKQMDELIGVEQTVREVDELGDIWTESMWWYPSDHPKFKIIGEKVKKGKQVKDVGVVKVSAYSVVNTKTGNAVEICNTRESARYWLSFYKTHPRDNYRIVRLGPVAFTR
jgi:hypothetical protein